MTAPTHRLGGLAVGMAIAAGTNTDLPAMTMIVAMSILGSLLPDIDNRHSSISRRWRLISSIIMLGQMIIRTLSRLLPKKAGGRIRSMIGHRGITHSFTAVLIFPVLTYAFTRLLHISTPWIYGAAMAGGVASHILLDMLAGGVPLLLPFSTKRIVLARIKTGGILEKIVRTIIIITFILLGLEQLI